MDYDKLMATTTVKDNGINCDGKVVLIPNGDTYDYKYYLNSFER